MEYTLKHYHQAKLGFLRIWISFVNNPPKSEDEWYTFEIINTSLHLVQNKIDKLEGKEEKLLKAYYRYLENDKKIWYNTTEKGGCS